MDEKIGAAALTVCALAYYKYLQIENSQKIKKQKKKRRWWMTQIHRNRTSFTMENQLREMFVEPSGKFKKFTRMALINFEYLLNQISPIISKQDTQLRTAIPARIRLAITLRFLASGDSYESLHFLFKVSPQLIFHIVPETCEALNQVLQNEIKMPSCAREWRIEEGFKKKFSHAVGAIDGKHIVIQCPSKSGSEYFNYKKTFSIVLLALVDSNYNIIFADIGSQGRISDGGVFRNSLLWEKISTNTLNLPVPQELHGSNTKLPHVFLGDGAFSLSANLMKPYSGSHEVGFPKRIFNQKLSSARVVVENTFGILSTKFRVFRRPLALCPEKVSLITMTCILLHNYLRKSRTSSQIYTPPGTTDIFDKNGEFVQPGLWRNEMDQPSAICDLPDKLRKSAKSAIEVRDAFTNYFCDHL